MAMRGSKWRDLLLLLPDAESDLLFDDALEWLSAYLSPEVRLKSLQVLVVSDIDPNKPLEGFKQLLRFWLTGKFGGVLRPFSFIFRRPFQPIFNDLGFSKSSDFAAFFSRTGGMSSSILRWMGRSWSVEERTVNLNGRVCGTVGNDGDSTWKSRSLVTDQSIG